MIPAKIAPRFLMIAYAFKNAYFTVPILMLFYGYKDVSMGDFFFIQGLFMFATFFMEIPTGYIGDLFSRKKTTIIGIFVAVIGYVFWVYGSGFWWLLGGEVMFAMSAALISGTIEAYFYDLLKKNNKQKDYHNKLAKLNAISDVGLMIGTFSGAFLYQYVSPMAPIYLTMGFMAFSGIIVMFMPDVPESRRIVKEGKSKWQDILDISHAAIKHPQIKWLMLFPACYGTMTLVLMWGLQSVMIARDLPIFLLSIVLGINAFSRFGWAAVSGKMLDKLSMSGVIAVLVAIICVACLGSSLSMYVPVWAVYVCLALMMLGSGSIVLAEVVTSTLINHRIQSDERATVLSVKSMVSRVMIGLGMISLKPMFDDVGIGQTYIYASLLLLPIAYFALRLYNMRLKTMED